MKKLCCILVTLMLALPLSSCNYQVVDMVYTFDYAYIKMPDGSIVEGKVTSWRDYEDGDQLQVGIGNTLYLTHATNVVLIKYLDEYNPPSDDEIFSETTTEGNFEVE